jgi:hypothetical protein
MQYAFRFILAALAVWRLTHLLAREDGPANVMLRLRRRFGRGFWGRLIECFNCLSLWVAVPFAFFLNGDAAEMFVGWLALSGGAALLERAAREPFELKIQETEEEPWDVAAKR